MELPGRREGGKKLVIENEVFPFSRPSRQLNNCNFETAPLFKKFVAAIPANLQFAL